jgi:cohesin loading factor subunit SCC2
MPPQPDCPQPHTPTSITDPHTPSGIEFFNSFVASTLDRAEPGSSPPNTDDGHPTPSHHRASSIATAPSSVSSTPSISRAMARTHFTPEASPGPSPSKKQKVNQSSPTPRTKSLPSGKTPRIILKIGSSSQPLNGSASSSLTSIGSSNGTPSGSKGRTVVEVEIPTKGKKPIVEEDEESEEDDLNWDEEPTIDADGDWTMGNESGRQSSERWDARGAPPGSGRTGDRDIRCKLESKSEGKADGSAHFQKLQSLLEDIFEESDSFSATPNSQDVLRSKFFGSLSSQTGQPLLGDKTVEKVSRYVTSLQKGKKRQTSEVVEWDPVMISTLLRLLERSMAGLDNINPFPNDKKTVAVKKKKKGKKEKTGSKSPEVDEEEPAQELAFTEAEAQHGQQLLDAFRSGALAAECCLTIMDTENIPKQVSPGICSRFKAE